MTSPSVTFIPVPFEPRDASPEQWARYHAYRRLRHAETRPEDPPLPDDVVEARMRRGDPFGEERRLLLEHGGRVIGSFYGGRVKPGAPGYASNQHLLWADASVLANERRQGIGRLWARRALDLMDDWGTTVLTCHTEEDDGHAFLRWLGAEPKSVGAENRLDLREVDWAMVDRWVEEGRAASAATRLEFYEHRVPEVIQGALCPAMSDMLNTMPFDDLDHGEIVFTPEMLRERYANLDETGGSHHAIVTWEPDGSISAVTDVEYLPARPDRVHQLFTGVRPDCRGRGLGKLIKASMLQYLRGAYPEARWVSTGNANSNDPMLAINRRLGFKTYRTGTAYQIGRDALAEALG